MGVLHISRSLNKTCQELETIINDVPDIAATAAIAANSRVPFLSRYRDTRRRQL